MSTTSSEGSGKVKLIANSGYPNGEVIVRNSVLSEVKRGTDSVEIDLAPGFYEVLFQAGNARSEKLIELPAGLTEPFVVWPDDLKVNSAAPLKRSAEAGSPADQKDPAVTLSEMTPLPSNGTGAQLYICVRQVSSEDPAAFPAPANPARGLKLFDFSEKLIFDCSAAQAIAGTAGVVIDIAPGAYLLRLDRGDKDSLEQTIYLSEGWRTQIFLPLQLLSTSDEELSPNLASASILLTLPGARFDADKVENAWVESARQDLASGRAVVPMAQVEQKVKDARSAHQAATDPATLKQMLRDKFTNPMLGIYAAHLIMASHTWKSEVKLDQNTQEDEANVMVVLREVADNLKILVGDHPDVLTIYLWLDSAASSLPFPTPPMLRTSWAILINRSVPRVDLVPRGSYSARIADRVWGSGAWLTWLKPDPPAEPPAPEPEIEQSLGRKFVSAVFSSLQESSTAASFLGPISQTSLAWVRTRLEQEGSASALVEKESTAKKLTSLEQTLFAYVVDVVQQQIHIEGLAAEMDRKGKIGALTPLYRSSDLYDRATASAIDFVSKEMLVKKLGMPEASILDAAEGLRRKLGQ